MNTKLAVSLIETIGHVDPPGCVSGFVDHPNTAYRHRNCVEVGFVLEHRFAFSYWIKCKQKLQQDRKQADDGQFRPPDLVTWDWHDDLGVVSEIVEDKLTTLNQADDQEVALYCWAGLRSLNDGQILPAVWLNALGNVYIIQKQDQVCRDKNQSVLDRFGREHHVYYFRSLKHFAKKFEKTNSGAGVIWDIDMDYFTQGRDVADQAYTRPLQGTAIRDMLSPKAAWMPLILHDLKAITVALEPIYTGGLSSSLGLYRHWESALFAAPVFSKNCRWRAGLCRSISHGR